MAVLELTLLTVFIILVVIFALVLRKLLVLVVNSIIGFFALFFASIFLEGLVINIWSILLTAVGGIIGFITVLVLHLTGIAF